MRPLLLALLLLIPGLVHAQLQESQLAERLLQPDRTLGNSNQDKTYYGGGTGLDFSKTANVKQFDFVQKFSPKSFETKAFTAKNFWMGSFKFSTKTASVKTDAQAHQTFATKAAAIKQASEANKSFTTDKGSYSIRDADVTARGKTSQEHLDELYKGSSKNMTIDEVRDLLNKPRLFN
ncbi:MAG TPA: hypothetical protein VHY22_02555 [Chthoniobacteraceae bacterium]|nr:hypothetical protein [Chthoniobacteraceae bacterium]